MRVLSRNKYYISIAKMGDGPRCGINLTFEERWNLLTRQQAKTLKDMEAKKRKKVEAEKKAADAAVQAAADAEYFKKQKIDQNKCCADSRLVEAVSASSSQPLLEDSLSQGSLTESQLKSICDDVWAQFDQGLLTGSQPLQDPEATPDTLDYDWSWLGELPDPGIDTVDKMQEADSQEAQVASPLPTLLDESLADVSCDHPEAVEQENYCREADEESQLF